MKVEVARDFLMPGFRSVADDVRVVVDGDGLVFTASANGKVATRTMSGSLVADTDAMKARFRPLCDEIRDELKR
jgi:hypothetical protein